MRFGPYFHLHAPAIVKAISPRK